MARKHRRYNTTYAGERLNRIAFPLGGIGAGMICLEGTGALSHFSIRNRPDVFNEPCIFSAISIKAPRVARVLEGPVPAWKVFGRPGAGNGAMNTTYGLPRFSTASFEARFPFATVTLTDKKIPLEVDITGWSPFIPGDSDNSSLPVAALEYRFRNQGRGHVDAVYSFNARNFMSTFFGGDSVQSTKGGFILLQQGSREEPWKQGAFCAATDDENARVNSAWFRSGWFDALSVAWKDVEDGACFDRPPVSDEPPSPGGTIFVPLHLLPGEEKTIRLMFSWYVPVSDLHLGEDPVCSDDCNCNAETNTEEKPREYRPWYSGRFPDIETVADYWTNNYEELRRKTRQFSACFYDSTLPPEIIEAIAANLTILKSPTVLRQTDGRLWCWEGCADSIGCCHGSCTHVWNYAQALPHLFPGLERTLRETEFNECQDESGHQCFRASLPIRPCSHDFHAAADGQLGGILKVYRDWRISGDTKWLAGIWPKVKASLDYSIETWDPEHRGAILEPHHNTYDIEFWGADGMCTSMYLGALRAAMIIGETLKADVSLYGELLEKGKEYLESELFDGEYFYQRTQWEGLHAENPREFKNLLNSRYSPEATEVFEKEGPKYQYGRGCLSDGIIGAWMSAVCGVPNFLDSDKVRSHLKALYRYNFREDLSEHANPQRPSFAVGNEGGLLICTWPRGGRPTLPFPYSNEVMTGMEYQVACHMMMLGMVEEGLEIVRTCRDRYDGRIRNPFDEYECGHWYARAMSSYALLQGMTGIRYDAVEKTLYVSPVLKGDFRSFLSTASGYGTAGIKNGVPFVEVESGEIDVRSIEYTGG